MFQHEFSILKTEPFNCQQFVDVEMWAQTIYLKLFKHAIFYLS